MANQDEIVLCLITDSTGTIERSDTNTHLKVENFRYQIKSDTLFELTTTHSFLPRKWIIYKVDKDSLIIYQEGKLGVVRYCRVL